MGGGGDGGEITQPPTASGKISSTAASSRDQHMLADKQKHKTSELHSRVYRLLSTLIHCTAVNL